MKKFNKDQFIKDAREVKKTFAQSEGWEKTISTLLDEWISLGFTVADVRDVLLIHINKMNDQSRLDAKKEERERLVAKIESYWPTNKPYGKTNHHKLHYEAGLRSMKFDIVETIKDTHE